MGQIWGGEVVEIILHVIDEAWKNTAQAGLTGNTPLQECKLRAERPTAADYKLDLTCFDAMVNKLIIRYLYLSGQIQYRKWPESLGLPDPIVESAPGYSEQRQDTGKYRRTEGWLNDPVSGPAQDTREQQDANYPCRGRPGQWSCLAEAVRNTKTATDGMRKQAIKW